RARDDLPPDVHGIAFVDGPEEADPRRPPLEPRRSPEPDQRVAQVRVDRGPRDEPAGEAVPARNGVVVDPIRRAPEEVPGPDAMDGQDVAGREVDGASGNHGRVNSRRLGSVTGAPLPPFRPGPPPGLGAADGPTGRPDRAP